LWCVGAGRLCGLLYTAADDEDIGGAAASLVVDDADMPRITHMVIANSRRAVAATATMM